MFEVTYPFSKDRKMAHSGPRFPVITERMGDLIALGGELSTTSVLEAYCKGCFPWTGAPPIPWCSPDPRLVLFPDRFKASHSLRKLARQRRFRLGFDRDFVTIMSRCAAMPRKDQTGTWITPNMIETYGRLNRMGYAHSVGVYEDETLRGGLYGLALGGVFFGESMFSEAANTSKLALFTLCRALSARGYGLIDCQQVTPHCLRLGAVPLTRSDYLALLKQLLAIDHPPGTWRDWSTQ